ncbi:MAG: outer membrane protein assembly factor BamA [Candidatus Westeberhardia cardiocondylae]|nr:outer membrane protein assembly factor BamA [Candidatus Westeberhardia cardiocondylae]
MFKHILEIKIKKILLIIFIISLNNNANAIDKSKIQNVDEKKSQQISTEKKIPPKKISKQHKTHEINFNSSYNKKILNNIQILYTKNIPCINITTNKPIITNISFYGNKIINENFLKKFLNTYNVYIGSYLNKELLYEAKKHIQKLYLQHGKYNTKISTIIQYLPNNCVNVNWKIYEGEWIKIKNIYIIGNNSFTYKKLMSNFKLKNSYSILKFNKKYTYQHKILTNDLKNLKNFYFNNGYITYKVNSITKKLTKDKKQISIIIDIMEGKQYKISDIKFHTNIIKKTEFFKIKQITQRILQTPYNYNNLKNIQNKIKIFFYNNGYLYPNINITLNINHINKKITPLIYINKGNRFYVNKIFFIGNKTVKNIIMYREMEQKEGKYLNIKLIEKGKKRLDYLGYFKDIKIKIQHIPNTLNKVNITYIVKEKNMGLFNFGLGFNNEKKLNFQINIEKNNLLGIGSNIFIQGDKNNDQYYCEFSEVNHYYKKNKNIINFNNKIYFNNYINSNISKLFKYNLQQYGTNILLNIPINTYKHFLNLELEYIHNDLYDKQPKKNIYQHPINYKSNIKEMKKNILSKYKYLNIHDILLSLHWNINNLNNNIFPNSGYNTYLTNKLTIPIFQNNYFQTIFEHKFFTQIIKKINLTLMEKLQFNYSKNINTKKIPFYDHLYTKEPNEIRIIYNNKMKKQNKHLNYNHKNKKTLTTKEQNFNTKNDIDIISSSELIIPNQFLLNKKYSNIIQTSLFFDIKKTWNKNIKKINNLTYIKHFYENLKNNKTRISTGINIKFMSPLGPLSISYGYPIKIYKNDKIEQLQFNIGKIW